MGHPTREDRKLAAQKAAQDWIEKHSGKQLLAAKKAAEKGITISQQALGEVAKGKKIGEAMVDRLAGLYDTTPDGLVVLFVRDVGHIALRDVPGFATALEEAMAERGSKVDAWVWHSLGSVVLPVRPRNATSAMLIDIAQFLDRWCSQSGVRPAVQIPSGY